jgi:hypothetical protein
MTHPTHAGSPPGACRPGRWWACGVPGVRRHPQAAASTSPAPGLGVSTAVPWRRAAGESAARAGRGAGRGRGLPATSSALGDRRAVHDGSGEHRSARRSTTPTRRSASARSRAVQPTHGVSSVNVQRPTASGPGDRHQRRRRIAVPGRLRLLVSRPGMKARRCCSDDDRRRSALHWAGEWEKEPADAGGRLRPGPDGGRREPD